MSEQETREVLERVAALPQEDQRNLAFFIAGLAAKNQGEEKPATDEKKE